MSKIRLDLSYEGTDFQGWQKQPHTDHTVQGQLELALAKLFQQKVRTVGAGRTDSGVHALHQVVHFISPVEDLSRYQIVRALNSLTPPQISVHRAFIPPDDFHAMGSSIGKTYKYLIHTGATPTALRRNFSTWIRGPLDLNWFSAASSHLIGKHDFSSFQSSGTEVKSSIRQIWKIKWTQPEPQLVQVELFAEGFLKQMVRNILGSLFELYLKGEDGAKIQQILAAKDRRKALKTAPPEGLYLTRVHYPQELDKRCRKI